MSYYRPPDDVPGTELHLNPAAPLPELDPPEPPRSVRKTRRPAAEPHSEPITWVVAFTAAHKGRADFYADALADHGIRAEVRLDHDSRVGPWVKTSYGYCPLFGTFEVLVPETEAGLAAALIEGPIREAARAVEDQQAFSPQPDDDLFLLRRRMEIEMPRSSPRAKDRAARRAFADLDGQPASTRPDQPPVDGCRQAMIVGMVVLLVLIVMLVLLQING